MESVAYEIRKKNESTIPKTTGWCPLLSNNIRPDSKRNNNNINNNTNLIDIFMLNYSSSYPLVLKYQVGVQWVIAVTQGQVGVFSLG